MKKQNTKRALCLSALSLLLCVCMLVGSTFAWFTDSVTSANNIIKSGNLDVELYYQTEGQSDWTKVTSTSNIFKENTLWEPGHTEVVKLKIVNEGSLALKYNLGVNIASETGSVNVEGREFMLSDYIKFGIVDGAQNYTREQAIAAVDATATTLKTAYNSPVKELLPKADNNTAEDVYTDIVTMVVYMPTTVGNEANHAVGAAQPTINLGINLFATQFTYEKDSFNDQYDRNAILVTSAEEAQAALDNAAPGTTIRLASGVDYGTLIFRQNASKKVVDITTMGGDARGNEKYSAYEDITIIGTEGAVVDQIDFQVGWVDSSVGASFVDIKNLTVKGVTFSGEKNAFNLEGSKGSGLGIDGLTIVDCKMNDANGNNRLVFQQITGYKVLNDKTTGEYVMTAGIKNLTITGCEVTGAYMVIESRAMENLTITNNVFKGIKERDMLITSDTTNHPNVTYTGAITITGNTSIEGEERFVRASLNNSDAVVVIKDNVLEAYKGADADYIKVEGGNNVTIEDNSITYGSTEAVQAALDKAVSGTIIKLAPGVNYGTLYFRAIPDVTPNTEYFGNAGDGNRDGYRRTLENIAIIGTTGATVDAILFEDGAGTSNRSAKFDVKNLLIEGVTFTANGGADYNYSQDGGQSFDDDDRPAILMRLANVSFDGVTIKDCIRTGECNYNFVRTYAHSDDAADNSLAKNLTITGCTIESGKRLCSLYPCENVTINNNIIKNTTQHGIHFSGYNSYTYSGNVTITGNTADGINNRFVRMASAGDAVVVIKDNTITNYLGTEADYIKVTDGTNVTIENNTKN